MGLSSIVHGATLVTLPRFIPNIYLTAIQNYKVSFVSQYSVLCTNINGSLLIASNYFTYLII